jgi:hypothetical protein
MHSKTRCCLEIKNRLIKATQAARINSRFKKRYIKRKNRYKIKVKIKNKKKSKKNPIFIKTNLFKMNQVLLSGKFGSEFMRQLGKKATYKTPPTRNYHSQIAVRKYKKNSTNKNDNENNSEEKDNNIAKNIEKNTDNLEVNKKKSLDDYSPIDSHHRTHVFLSSSNCNCGSKACNCPLVIHTVVGHATSTEATNKNLIRQTELENRHILAIKPPTDSIKEPTLVVYPKSQHISIDTKTLNNNYKNSRVIADSIDDMSKPSVPTDSSTSEKPSSPHITEKVDSTEN